MEGVAAYSSPRPLASAPRAGSLPVAVLVALGSLFVAAAAVLVIVALLVLVAGHRSVALGRQPLLMAAGFSCAYAAAAMRIWRGGRLHPAAVAVVWALGLCVAVPGAAFAGAAVAALGGAVAIALGSSPPLWRDRRLIVGLSSGALVLSIAAAALSPAATARPAAPSNTGARSPAVATPTAVAATPAPSSAAATPAATPAPSPAVASPAATPASSAAAGPPVTATPAAGSPVSRSGGAVAPVPPETAAAVASIVRDFYAALDARRFAAAWGMLPRALQTAFGGFTHWREGYRTTLGSRPEQIAVTATADGDLLVRHVLVATDRRGCGTQTRRYAVRWRLERSRASWGVASLTATALDPATASCR